MIPRTIASKQHLNNADSDDQHQAGRGGPTFNTASAKFCHKTPVIKSCYLGGGLLKACHPPVVTAVTPTSFRQTCQRCLIKCSERRVHRDCLLTIKISHSLYDSIEHNIQTNCLNASTFLDAKHLYW